MRIRLGRSEDMPAVQRIYREVHPEPRGDQPWNQMFVFVAEHDDQVLGYASAILDGTTFYLIETLVLPEHQGKGLGRQLMQARLELGEKLCAVEAIGGIDPAHESMKHLLESQGFELDPEIDPALLGPGRVGYSKVLTGWA